MEILTQSELQKRYHEVLEKIKQGAVFIHPSDTIYGLSCDATNIQAVTKVRQLKQQFQQPLSIWVPSIDWVKAHCLVSKEAQDALAKLPGPYTLVLKLKKKILAQNVTLGNDTIGIRLPDHWFTKVVKDAGVPLITTSANKTGQKFMTSLDNLSKDIERGVEFMIYEGEKNTKPSKIINLVEGTVKER